MKSPCVGSQISRLPVLALLLSCTTPACVSAAETRADILLSDFEESDYAFTPGGTWAQEGRAFARGPVNGTLENQQTVHGFSGRGVVNSYQGGDGPTGRLISPSFRIERNFIVFLVGGGQHPGKCCINLVVNDQVARTAMGRDKEQLIWQSWDVKALRGKDVRLEIVDNASGGWGHVLVDDIYLADQPRLQWIEDLLALREAGLDGKQDRVNALWGRIQSYDRTFADQLRRDLGGRWKDWVANKEPQPALELVTVRVAAALGGAGANKLSVLQEQSRGGAPNLRMFWAAYHGAHKFVRQRDRAQSVGATLKKSGSIRPELAETIQQLMRGELSITDPKWEDVERAAARARCRQLGANEIIFCTRAVDGDGHWYANFGTWSSNPERKLYHPGGKLCRMDLRTGDVTILLEDKQGGVRDPQIHYDGKTILFSYRKGDDPYYHLYEINADGSDLRQITDGPYDDIEPAYLPDGGIVFCSSRCNRWVNCYFVRVAVITRCDRDGKNMRALSANIEQDNTPWVLPDGRILYQRWEYIDRSQVQYHHLWTMNPDGTGQMVYFGNMHGGTVMIDAKPIPGTRKVVASFSPGHGRKEHAGYVTIVDPERGPDTRENAKALCKQADWRDPYPLSEDAFLVAGSDTTIELMDGDGRTVRLHDLSDADKAAGQWVHEPRPLRPRPRERVIPPAVNLVQKTGTVSLQDVYIGRNMEGVKRGDIKKLLVLEVLPKPVNFSGGMEPLTLGGSFSLERILGTVPVEADGSAYFELPALRSLFFVALDKNDLSVKRMQSFLTVQPGETVSCVGCHENRSAIAPTMGTRLAMTRAPSQIEPIRDVPDVFDFPRDIQPILDRHCVACHGHEKTEQGGPRAGGMLLVGDRGPQYSISYAMLTTRRLFSDGRNGGGNRPPRAIGSSASRILTLVDGSHHEAKLSTHEQKMLRLWIESAAAYPGTYAALGSGMVSVRIPKAILDTRCVACHKDGKPPFDPHVHVNLTHPEKSAVLLTTLSPEGGGCGMVKRGTPTDKASHPVWVFERADDPDYQAILASISQAGEQLKRIGRFDDKAFRPNAHYVREMKFYGILNESFGKDDPIDVYATDQAYWRSHWYGAAERHGQPAN